MTAEPLGPGDRSIPDDVHLSEAAAELAQLYQRADQMRLQLAQLQRDLAVAHRDSDGNHGARLIEANSQLVEAALLAQTEAASALAALRALAMSSQIDPLTGLPNRSVLLVRLAEAIAAAKEHRKSLAVIFFDVDGLKQINDMYGHQAGDEALQQVAQRLLAMVGDRDTVCRYGGDEFVVLSETLDDAEAAALGARMMAALATPVAGQPGRDGISASAGIAVHPLHGEDPATLLKHADEAMYVAKRAGAGQCALHGAAVEPRSSAEAPAMASRQHAEDLREANTQLLAAAVQAQTHEADAREDHRRQIQYMAMVAHELRNPLVPIRIAAGLLIGRSADESPTLARLQTIIERQVVQIARLVEDLLEGSRVAAGKLRLDMIDIDLAETLEQAVLTGRPGMELRKQAMVMDLGSAPLPMRGDPVRLLQVFCNLLDNASKYTPPGGAIRLAASASPDSLTVTVSDNGAGISPLAITRIFDLFEQDDYALALDSRGLGIGLAVVRELVDSHGGSVTAHSEGKGKGSEFVVTLPTATAAADRRGAAAP